MSKRRKKYSKEFKVEAIQLVKEQGYTCSEAARCLGIRQDLISRWKREFSTDDDDTFRGNGQLTAEQKRIRDLEDEVRHLRMEKDILKKATAFFAKEST